jgi:hypothetical protein
MDELKYGLNVIGNNPKYYDYEMNKGDFWMCFSVEYQQQLV